MLLETLVFNILSFVFFKTIMQVWGIDDENVCMFHGDGRA